MKTKSSIRRLVASEKPLITIAAHDALSARLIQRAGFKSIGIGGSMMLAARFGLPDLGLAALGEMAAGIGDIVAATDLPVMADGDDGYGDVKSVAYTTEVYTRIGVSGIVLEDQMRVAKQPGDAKALALESPEVMAQKLKAAIAARAGAEMQVVARSDAYQSEGLQGALRRCEHYLKAGADGIFIPGVQNLEHLSEIGKTFRGTHIVVAMFEERGAWMNPSDLYAMGFNQVVYSGILERISTGLNRDFLDSLGCLNERIWRP